MSDDPALRTLFGAAFEAAIPTQPSSPTDYDSFLWRIKQASAVLPRKGPAARRAPPWDNNVVRIWDARLQRSQNPTRASTDALLNAVDSAVVADATAQVESYVTLLARHPWLAWKHVFLLARKEHDSGSFNTAAAFTHHFAGIMCPPQLPDLPPLLPLPPPQPPPKAFPTGPFTTEEFELAVSKMANHKAPGCDLLQIEVFRCPHVCAAAVPIVNHIFDNSSLGIESVPQLLLDAFLTPIYKKKGDKDDVKNYRPVVLLSQLLKILDRMVLLRMRDSVDATVLLYQTAYRERRGCMQHILALHHLLCRSRKAHDHPLYVLFVDFSRAFDSVSRARLADVLRYYSVPESVITYILCTLEHQRLFARGSDTTSGVPITPTAGVMQGDTLAPYLFDLCIDYILRQLPYDAGCVCSDPMPIRVRGQAPIDGTLRVPALAYADDIATLSNTSSNCQRLLSALESAAASIGLSINMGPGKTEVLIVGDREPGWSLPHLSTGAAIPEVDHYKYLGWNCTAAGDWESDFAVRRRNAWFVLRTYNEIWKSVVPNDTKRRLFYVLVIPVLTYAASTYPPSLYCRRKLHTVCNSMLRYALDTRIMWDPDEARAHIHTAELYDSYPTLPTVLSYQLLNTWGHWVRDVELRDMEHAVVDVLSTQLTLRNHRSGTRHNPAHTLEILTRLDADDSYALCIDRDAWRRHVFHCALDVEMQMYDSWILPRRIHGLLGPVGHSRVLEHRRSALTRWLHDRRVFD